MSEEWSKCKDSFGVGVGQHQGSTLSADGKKEKETSGRTQERWKSCRDVSGVLCDKKYLKLKREKYKSVIRLALTPVAEAIPAKKSDEKRMEVAEVRTLR